MQYLTAEERALLDLERQLRDGGATRPGSLSPWLLVVVGIAVLLWSVSSSAAPGTVSVSVQGFGSYAVNADSNSCADVVAGWNAYRVANGWTSNWTASTCSSDPVVVGTSIPVPAGYPTSVTSITATSTGTTTPPANGDPVLSGMPTTIGAVDHVSFTYGIMAVCFCIGLGIGVRI